MTGQEYRTMSFPRRMRSPTVCNGSRFCYRLKIPGSDYCHFHDLLMKARAGNEDARKQLLEQYGTKLYSKGEIEQWNHTN